uniref:PUM-HD domain-containing protein n=1 Tax=Strongyloides papillosus TaxID=174720 RepID=A0A0N5C5N8_STREA
MKSNDNQYESNQKNNSNEKNNRGDESRGNESKDESKNDNNEIGGNNGQRRDGNNDKNNNNNNRRNNNSNNNYKVDENKSDDNDDDEKNEAKKSGRISTIENVKSKRSSYPNGKAFNRSNLTVKGVGNFNNLKNIERNDSRKIALFSIPKNSAKGIDKNNIKKTESLITINNKDDKNIEDPSNVNEIAFKPIVKRLHYTKIVTTLLKNLNSRNTALLLQALRQQITRKENKEASIEVIKVFAFKDILNLRNANNSIVYNILLHHDSKNHIIKEEFARLLNAIASFKVGRAFLINFSYGKNFIYPSVVALKNKRLDDITSSHILAAIQKVSIKPVVQKELLQQNILDWLVKIIVQESISSTFFDFGIALISNLVLNPFVQSHIIRITHDLVMMLLIILQRNNFKDKNIIYGIMYVVLELRKVRVKVKELKVDEILYKHLKVSTSYEEKCIIAFLLCCLLEEYDYGNKKVYSLSENDDNWDDYIEAEIESTDRLRPGALECFGEKLLIEKFQIRNDQKDIYCQAFAEIDRKSTDMYIDSPQVPLGTVTNKNSSFSLNNPLSRTTTTASSKHNLKIISGNKQQNNIYGRTSRSLSRSTPKINDSNKPPNSTTSFKTFILENDKRKPLILPCGIKSAVLENLKLIRAKLTSLNIPLECDDNEGSRENKINLPSKDEIKKYFVIPKKVNIEKTFVIDKKKPIKSISIYKKNDLYSNENFKNELFSKDKYNNTLQIETFDNTSTSNPPQFDGPHDDIDIDYNSVFLSRPKVLRTPDKVNLSKDDFFF